MATFVLLTKLPSETLREPRSREAIGRQWFDEVKKQCPEVKWIEHYALLGRYDFMDIYEASSAEEAAKVSMITMSKGAVEAETWSALPYKQFLDIAKSL